MNTKFSTCDWYILLWIIQIVHEPLGLFGDRISVLLLFALYLWSLYYCYIALTRYKLPPFLKAWSALFLLFSIYGIVRILNPMGLTYDIGSSVSARSRQFLMQHWTSMLPIFPFYVFSSSGQLKEKGIKRWAILFVGVAIIQYFYGRSIAISKLSYFDDETQITNNMGYFIAMVAPMFFFWRNKPLVQYVGNAILMVFVLLAVKRGAILISFICLILQLYYSVIKQKKSNPFWMFIIVAAFVSVGYYVFSNLLSSNEYFAFRIEATLEGNDSNRGDIYSQLFQAFLHTDNLIYLLFGRGADGTVLLLHVLAHNDWLEILIDMGIVGVAVFGYFWIRSFSDYLIFQNRDLQYIFMVVILMLLVRSFFSMSINDMPLSTNIVLGYCLANMNKGITNNRSHV